MAIKQVFSYSSLHSRTRALMSGLLTTDTWELLYAANDFEALVMILRESVYRPYLEHFEVNSLTSRRAIYEIRKHLTNGYLGLMSISGDPLKSVLSLLLRLYEVDNLKAALRGILIGESWDRVRHTFFPLGDFGNLPCEAMLATGNLEEAIGLLKGTPYFDPLSRGLIRYRQENNLFVLEVVLDLDYWRRLWKECRSFSQSDWVQVRPLVGTLMDMNNLLWALRYRIYYHLSEEEIINYTLPFGYRVADEQIRRIAAGGDMGYVLGELYPEYPMRNSFNDDPQQNLPFLENWLMRRSIDVCRKSFAGYPFHAGIPIAYLHLLAMEIEDLTVLIEAKSMGFPFNRFKKFLLYNQATLDV
ncbi:MAG: V-type ATPase subunit [Anaerolineae bacterium]|jgi:vacuolar-type H+-ATPase subunit C/Vma6|nr:V-type ATPase subunit [Anaerolineae bacterium]